MKFNFIVNLVIKNISNKFYNLVTVDTRLCESTTIVRHDLPTTGRRTHEFIDYWEKLAFLIIFKMVNFKMLIFKMFNFNQHIITAKIKI